MTSTRNKNSSHSRTRGMKSQRFWIGYYVLCATLQLCGAVLNLMFTPSKRRKASRKRNKKKNMSRTKEKSVQWIFKIWLWLLLKVFTVCWYNKTNVDAIKSPIRCDLKCPGSPPFRLSDWITAENCSYSKFFPVLEHIPSGVPFSLYLQATNNVRCTIREYAHTVQFIILYRSL